MPKIKLHTVNFQNWGNFKAKTQNQIRLLMLWRVWINRKWLISRLINKWINSTMYKKNKRRKIKDLMEIDQITERNPQTDHLKLITHITQATHQRPRDPLNLQPMVIVGSNMSQGQLISFQKTITTNWSIRIMMIQTLLIKMKTNLKPTRKMLELDQICIM